MVLVNSGIGGMIYITVLQIPVVADLPVGKNLQDHLQMDALIFTLDKNISVTPKKSNSLWTRVNYALTGGG